MQGEENPKPAGAPEGDPFLLNAPQVSLPRGGGAIRGMGERFTANAVTGTGSMQVPLAVSPGRASFGPDLALGYDSGAGNGPFGLGWTLGLPSITRKTDRGLPRYRDADESDAFILSGSEDLVPALVPSAAGGWAREVLPDRTLDGATYAIHRYRPRVEGAFARIERWTNRNNAADRFWRSISPDNLTRWFGRTPASRVADPRDGTRIFSWLISEAYDDKGNVVAYEYDAEDFAGLDLTQAHERNRDRSRPGAVRHIRRIKYGNTPSRLAPNFQTDLVWHFEVMFDYEQGHYRTDQPDAVGDVYAYARYVAPASAQWAVRADPHSSYRAGFEVRTYRLCRRVLMFHRFPELGQDAQLVRATELTYAESPSLTRLASVTHCSYAPARLAGAPLATGEQRYLMRTLPSLDLQYSDPVVEGAVREVDAASVENLPHGLGDSKWKWVDLDGEGLSGILTEQDQGWFYKRNLAPVTRRADPDGVERTHARFARSEPVALRPNAALAGEGVQLLDLAGDGTLDFVSLEGPTPGFYERDDDSGWRSFRAFLSRLNRSARDPNLRFVDLDGDGRADVLITEHEAFTWQPSLGEDGFGAPRHISRPHDEESGPALVFADGTDSIYLADMSGDGLTDLVRIRNGEICYWPNLGYGAFGAKVTMDDAPWFDEPEVFDRRRLQLADLDGSGVTDIVYLHRDGPRLYFNLSGNGWGSAQPVPQFPHIDSLSTVAVVDLLASGTACLVWSSPAPGDARRPMKYVDLFGGRKPHLLIGIRNNLGAETTLEYTPSTRFYLQDKLAGEPWLTKLPFPVHCVSKVIQYDSARETTFSCTYTYHHGYFDPVEREFRGFGRVEQIDTQRFDEFSEANRDSAFIAADQKLYQPPVKTVTWFHAGIGADRTRTPRSYAHEFFRTRYAARLAGAGFAERALPDPDIDASGPELTEHEWREALRGTRNTVLRQEVYELDLDDLNLVTRLFSATEHRCHVRRVQPRGLNPHAVFAVMESEAISYQYDLSLAGTGVLKPDPRISHTLNLKFDGFARPEQAVSAVYPRLEEFQDTPLHPAPLTTEQVKLIRAVQRELHLAYVETRLTDELPLAVDAFRTTAPCEVQTFELTGIAPSDGRYFSLDGLRQYDLSNAVETIAYHEQPAAIPRAQRRLVEHVVTLYFKDDLSGPLAFGTGGRLGLTYETYRLALTSPLLNAVLVSSAGEDLFADEVRNVLAEAGARAGFFASGYQTDAAIFATNAAPAQWWLRSGIAGFESDAPRHFYLPERYVDCFGNETTVAYDRDDLFIASSTDGLGNTATVEAFDHRVLTPVRLKDANDNVAEVAFDVLGLPVAAALLGKVTAAGSETGNSITSFTLAQLNPPAAAVRQFFETQALNEEQARRWLGQASARFIYYLGSVSGACSILRERHERDLPNTAPQDPAQRIPIQVTFEYSDGSGRVLVTKVQAEPAPGLDPDTAPSRWIANGKTLYNNKGTAVLQYEPYFSASGPRFEEPAAAGVATALFYDAADRVVRTEFPDGTLSRVEFTPWSSRTFDPSDTVKESRWYSVRLSGSADAQRAARLTALHAETPTEAHFDTLGRGVITLAHNRSPDATAIPAFDRSVADWGWKDERYVTFTKLDTESKPLWVCDARGNLLKQHVMPAQPNRTRLYAATNPDYRSAYDMPAQTVSCYDISGNVLFQHTPDAGSRRMLLDAAGQPLLAWDYNERTWRRFRVTYDALHRPSTRRLRIRDVDTNAQNTFLVEQTRYGEGQPQDKARNLRGGVWQHYDGAGFTQRDRLDLAGLPLTERRRLASDFTSPVLDWTGRVVDDVHSASTNLAADVFTARATYDAVGRLTRRYNWHVESAPDSETSPRVAVYLPRYNRRGSMRAHRLLVRARKVVAGHQEIAGTTRSRDAISEITYDAKGQKLTLDLGNGTTTRYAYDAESFRLTRVLTRRGAEVSQDLNYTYDASGNVVHIEDDAQQTIFFANAAVEPSTDFVYDAIHRLMEGSGREHVATGVATTPEAPWPTATFTSNVALRTYLQRYTYDSVGNILEMRHLAPRSLPAEPPGWTRQHRYAADSNRLLETWYGRTRNPAQGRDDVSYGYDVHGNTLNLNQSNPRFDLQWNWNDMIHTADLGGGGRAWYQYGADRQRCRKRVVNQNNLGGYWERIDLGGFERYRRYSGIGTTPVEEIESHHVVEQQRRVLLVDDVLVSSNADERVLFRYQYANHLGSVALELDETGRVISYEEFRPFGSTAYRSMNLAARAPPKRYRYTGMERDEESGLSYHGARYYAPALARWLSCDPLLMGAEAAPTTPYGYAAANPLSFSDPEGLKERDPALNFDRLFSALDRIVADERQRAEQRRKLVPEASRAAGQAARDVLAANRQRRKEAGLNLGYGIEWLGKELEKQNLKTDDEKKKYVQERIKELQEKNLQLLSCLSIYVFTAQVFAANLGQSADINASIARAADARGKGDQAVFGGRGTVLLEELRTKFGFETVHFDTDPGKDYWNLANYTSDKDVRQAGTVPITAQLVAGADTNEAINVKVRVNRFIKMEGEHGKLTQEGKQLLEQLKKVEFAVGVADSGYHTFAISRGRVFEIHWKKGPSDAGLITSMPLIDFIKQWGSLVIAVPPSTLKRK